MIHRREFAIAGLSAAAVAALHGIGGADDAKPGIGSSRPADRFEPCARACSDCQRECDYCAAHCADMAGKGEQTHLVTLQMCLDCADVCAAASQVTARHGLFSEVICQACAEACARCAKECEILGKNDEIMAACAQQCRHCEKACREMLEHAGSPAK